MKKYNFDITLHVEWDDYAEIPDDIDDEIEIKIACMEIISSRSNYDIHDMTIENIKEEKREKKNAT